MWRRDVDEVLASYVRWIGRNRWFTYVMSAAVIAFYAVLGLAYGLVFLERLVGFLAICALLGVLRALRARRRHHR